MKNLIQAFKENPVTIVLAIGIIAIGTAIVLNVRQDVKNLEQENTELDKRIAALTAQSIERDMLTQPNEKTHTDKQRIDSLVQTVSGETFTVQDVSVDVRMLPQNNTQLYHMIDTGQPNKDVFISNKLDLNFVADLIVKDQVYQYTNQATVEYVDARMIVNNLPDGVYIISRPNELNKDCTIYCYTKVK